MKMAKYKITTINGKELMWEFTECEPNKDDYGNGIYIAVEAPSGDISYIDCRYITGYNFHETCKEYLTCYYCSNLKHIQEV